MNIYYAPSKILLGFKSQLRIYMEADSPLIQQSHNTHCIATYYNFKKTKQTSTLKIYKFKNRSRDQTKNDDITVRKSLLWHLL